MTDLQVVDSREDHLDLQPETTLEKLQTILPYFPDDERMTNYLCYLSSGWTRAKALIRAGADNHDYNLWLKDPRFAEIDSLPYNELRENIANAYAELRVRRLAMQYLEFDEEFLQEVQRKLATGEELTKDERAIYLKRAGLYGPEAFNSAKKLISGESMDENSETNQVFDIAVFVRSRRAS